MEVTIKLVKMDIFVIDKDALEGAPANISEDKWLESQQIMTVFMENQKKLAEVYNDS